jgi:hypothetical protein
MTEYHFAAQFQQDPQPPSGLIVLRKWLKFYDERKLYLRNVFRRRLESPDLKQSVIDLAALWKARLCTEAELWIAGG